jgi:hypothetical protein
MRELFVYYRVDPRHAARAMDIVGGWQHDLRAAHAPLLARLLKRPADNAASSETWMETYANFGDALLAELSAGPAALPPLIDDERHVEVFIACAS